jgi:hypothetical protein
VYGFIQKTNDMPGRDAPSPSLRGLGPAGWIAIIALGALLGAAIWFAFYGWNLIEGPAIPESGLIALALGVVFSMALGAGLMALMFWSHRRGFDR